MNRTVQFELLCYAIGLLVACVGLLGTFHRERQGRAEASDEPEEILLADLIARGGNGNAHLWIKDVVPCKDLCSIERDDQGETWAAVYVPAIPGTLPLFNQPLPPRPARIDVLLLFRQIRREQDITLLRSPLGFKGMVINRFDPPSQAHSRVLEAKYPGIDVGRCIVFEVERQPMKSLDIEVFAWLGLICGAGSGILFGLAALGWRRRQRPSSNE
jgi:hypothetical protein